eukprot:2585510-Rhodomonas_salina.3
MGKAKEKVGGAGAGVFLKAKSGYLLWYVPKEKLVLQYRTQGGSHYQARKCGTVCGRIEHGQPTT